MKTSSVFSLFLLVGMFFIACSDVNEETMEVGKVQTKSFVLEECTPVIYEALAYNDSIMSFAFGWPENGILDTVLYRTVDGGDPHFKFFGVVPAIEKAHSSVNAYLTLPEFCDQYRRYGITADVKTTVRLEYEKKYEFTVRAHNKDQEGSYYNENVWADGRTFTYDYLPVEGDGDPRDPNAIVLDVIYAVETFLDMPVDRVFEIQIQNEVVYSGTIHLDQWGKITLKRYSFNADYQGEIYLKVENNNGEMQTYFQGEFNAYPSTRKFSTQVVF